MDEVKKLLLESPWEGLDHSLLCPGGETACPMYVSFSSFLIRAQLIYTRRFPRLGSWECLDTQSELESCGGCSAFSPCLSRAPLTSSRFYQRQQDKARIVRRFGVRRASPVTSVAAWSSPARWVTSSTQGGATRSSRRRLEWRGGGRNGHFDFRVDVDRVEMLCELFGWCRSLLWSLQSF